MIAVLSTLFLQAGVMPPVNDIAQICRYLGEQSNLPNLYLKSQRLLNYAIYDKMTCMLHLHVLAVTIIWKQIFKIQSRNAFLLHHSHMPNHNA